MRKVIVYILSYFFVYQNIAFVPRFYGSYYNILAFMFFICNIVNFLHYKKLIINKKIFRLFFYLILVILSYFISLIINNVSLLEVNPIRNMVLRIFLDFNYIIFIINLLKKEKNKELIFFKGIIYSSFIDAIFSILRFNFDKINYLFLKLYPPTNKVIKMHLILKERLMGFGGFFFGAGIIFSISLILLVYVIKNKNVTKKEKIYLSFVYIFILFIGILISRTVIIGFFLSGFYFFMLSKNKIKDLKNIVMGTILILLVSYIFFYFFNTSGKEWITNFVYTKGKGSVMAMLKMYNVFPQNIKTLLIGDSLWGDVDTGYYMNTDIGYIRAIFFYGVIGLGFQLFFNYQICKVKSKEMRSLSNILLLLYLIVNFKGYMSYFPIYLFIYVLDNIENTYFNDDFIGF